MKLIKQANLAFRRGRSDKVYEVDLCEVGPDQYVVNFRYGRRGATLRDGSKTLVAVPLEEAQAAFDKLVDSKVTKGYTHVDPSAGAPPPAPPVPPTPTPQAPPTGDPLPGADPYRTAAAPGEGGPYRGSGQPPRAVGRERAVLDRLARGDRAPRGAWPLDRAIWRAGELELAQAEPQLLNLLDTVPAGKKDLRLYGLVWALGRCGSTRAIPAILRIYQDRASKPATHRIAAEALRRLYGEIDRQTFIDGLIGTLPPTLAGAVREGPTEQLIENLRGALGRGDRGAFRALHTLYLVDNEHARAALLEVIREAPMARDYFQALRALFKCSEYRHDGEVFGLLARRFETVHANSYSYHQRDRVKPFGTATRQYLRLRTWRVLRRLGELEHHDWVRMAVGVLLPFTDDDAREPREANYWTWQNERRVLRWGPYADFWAFNHLLYGNSTRYRPDERGRAWRSSEDTPRRGRGRPGRPARRPGAPGREESFPQLWDRMPAALLHLLDGSRCEPVHQFGVMALRANPRFLDQLDTDPVIMLLGRPYEVTARLGFDLAVRLYNSSAPDWELVSGVALCAFGPARDQARQWIEGQRAAFLQQSELVALLASSVYADNRTFCLNLLRSAVLPDAQVQAIIGRLFAVLQQLGEGEGQRAADIGTILVKAFGAQLSGIGVQVIRDLMGHVLPEVQELAGDLLLAHTELACQVPDDILLGLLSSEREAVRGIGARLLGQLPDTSLLQRQDLLVQLSLHAAADLRQAIRPVIGRLAASQPQFAASVAAALMEALRRKERAEGVHSHLLSLLKQELQSCLGAVDRDQVWRLLQAKYSHAQELGGILLASNVDAEELSIRQIVRLASHDILSVRQASWAMSHKSLERFKQGMPSAVRMLDASWEDSRAFAFGFFRDNFDSQQLTPAILVSICDSVREDVQQFGRELITRYFTQEHGQEYLLKLSEHPSEALQLFATNYLERFAAGNLERIEQLRSYFVSVLSRVNRGRVAKSRILAFLHQQALVDEQVARIVAEILTRQSVTMAIGDKATMIEAMLSINRTYPDIQLPLVEHDVEVRRGV